MEITQDNFDAQYADPIERKQIRHFVCKEMERQIHRYIKAMHGSKGHMLRFEEHLKDFSLDEKEQAIARYFDLNRKAASGLDLKIILARPWPTIAIPISTCSSYFRMRPSSSATSR